MDGGRVCVKTRLRRRGEMVAERCTAFKKPTSLNQGHSTPRASPISRAPEIPIANQSDGARAGIGARLPHACRPLAAQTRNENYRVRANCKLTN
jgi:hypothetical protein